MHSLREPHRKWFQWKGNHSIALTHIMNESSATLQWILYNNNNNNKLWWQCLDARSLIPQLLCFSFRFANILRSVVYVSLFLFSLSFFILSITFRLWSFQINNESTRVGCDYFNRSAYWCIPNQWTATNPRELNHDNKQANHAMPSDKNLPVYTMCEPSWLWE